MTDDDGNPAVLVEHRDHWAITTATLLADARDAIAGLAGAETAERDR
ncbi:MAG: hypothetical protein PIR02_04630 [Microbacterium enclense]